MWPTKRLGDVLSIQNGFAFDSGRFNDSGQGVPLIRIRNLASSRTDTCYDGSFGPEYTVGRGDFLIGMDGEFRCYKWQGPDALLNQRVCRLHQFRPEIDPDFVFYGINEYLATIESRTDYVTVKHLSSKQIAAIEMPLPPLAEQRRIVGILDEAQRLRALRQQADRRTADLIPALFHDMFGDPATNPNRWQLRRVEEVAHVQGGITLGQKRNSLPLRRPYLRVANVRRGYLILDEVKEIGLTLEEERKTELRESDILLVEGNGNPQEVGRAAMWNGSIKKCVHQNHLIRVRCEQAVVSPEYFIQFVNSESGRAYFLGAGNTTSGLVTLNMTRIKQCAVPLPPLPLQKQFASAVGEIRAMQEKQAAARRRLDDPFQSLLHRAFRGEL